MMLRLKQLIRNQSDVIKHGAVYLSSRVGTKILGFLMLPVWTLLLSPEQYGVIGLVSAYTGMIIPLFLFGIPSAIVRNYHDCHGCWSAYLKSIFAFITSVLVLLFVGMYFWGGMAGENAPAIVGKYRGVFFVSLAGGALTQLAVAALQAERSSKQFIIGNFVSYITGLCLSLLLVIYFEMGPYGFLYGMGLGCFAGVGYTATPTITIDPPARAGVSTGNYMFKEMVRGVSTGTTAIVADWDRDDRILKVTNVAGSGFAAGAICERSASNII